MRYLGVSVMCLVDGRSKCAKGTCAKAFTSYYQVFLSAKPATGWKLKSWTGACRGTKLKCRLGMTAPSAARATFVKKR